MQDARKFACNALFGECNANAIKMCCNYVIMHDEKFILDAPPQNAAECNTNLDECSHPTM